MFNWRQIEPDRVSRDRNVMVGKFYVWNFDNTLLSDGVMAFPRLTFRNYWSMKATSGGFGRVRTIGSRAVVRRRCSLPSASVGLSVNSDSRKRVVLHLNGGSEWGDSGGGPGQRGISVDWKPRRA